MNVKWLLPCTIATLVFCAAANAGQDHWYVSLGAGKYFPDKGPDAFARKLDDGLTADLRFGVAPLRNLAVELGVTGYRAEGELPPVNVTRSTIHLVETTGVRVSVKGLWPLAHDRLVPFAGVGFGYYFVNVDIKDPPSSSREAKDQDFGEHAVAGMTFAATPGFGFGIEYEHVWLSPGSTRMFPPPDVDVGGDMARLFAQFRW